MKARRLPSLRRLSLWPAVRRAPRPPRVPHSQRGLDRERRGGGGGEWVGLECTAAVGRPTSAANLMCVYATAVRGRRTPALWGHGFTRPMWVGGTSVFVRGKGSASGGGGLSCTQSSTSSCAPSSSTNIYDAEKRTANEERAWQQQQQGQAIRAHGVQNGSLVVSSAGHRLHLLHLLHLLHHLCHQRARPCIRLSSRTSPTMRFAPAASGLVLAAAAFAQHAAAWGETAEEGACGAGG